MKAYIDDFKNASNDVYKIFQIASIKNADPTLAFKQLRERYSGSDCEEYVSEYSKLCEDELKTGRVDKAYLSEARQASIEIWDLFKKLVPKVYEQNMTDRDWNIVVQKTSELGMNSKWKLAKYYALKYSSILAWELDRKSRRLRGIMTDDLSQYLMGEQ